jgi:hypothetical protein
MSNLWSNNVMLKEWYERTCDKYFGITITGMVRREEKSQPWLFILLAVIGGMILVWVYKKYSIPCIISVFVGILIGHFFWN